MAKLNCGKFPELSEIVLLQLSSKKINTVFDFVRESNDNLLKLSGLSFKDILNVKKRIHETYGGYKNKASKLLRNDEKVSTGIQNFDVLTEGGFCTGCIYELCGLPAAGKSQLCLTIAIHVASRGKYIHYIDTKNDFCASRIFTMLRSRKYTDKEITRVMSSIVVSRVKDINELLTLLHDLADSRKFDQSSATIIIDSLPELFFMSYKNHNEIVSLNQLANICKFIAGETRAVIICVNMVTQWREMDGFLGSKQGNPTVIKPSLGNYWLHIPDTRFFVEELDKEERKITVWKSTDLKIDGTCLVSVENVGVV